MHYVCFHYEFEHDGDVDWACSAGGCPSAGLPTAAPHTEYDPAVAAFRTLDGKDSADGLIRVSRFGAGSLGLSVGQEQWLVTLTRKT